MAIKHLHVTDGPSDLVSLVNEVRTLLCEAERLSTDCTDVFGDNPYCLANGTSIIGTPAEVADEFLGACERTATALLKHLADNWSHGPAYLVRGAYLGDKLDAGVDFPEGVGDRVKNHDDGSNLVHNWVEVIDSRTSPVVYTCEICSYEENLVTGERGSLYVSPTRPDSYGWTGEAYTADQIRRGECPHRSIESWYKWYSENALTENPEVVHFSFSGP